MNQRLSKTKIGLPPPGPDRVIRARLLARLEEGLNPACRLILTAAPAGYGKTSLIADWLRQNAHPAAWVSLENADNFPERFAAVIAAALRLAYPGLDLPDLEGLASAQPLPLPALVEELLERLIRVDMPVLLVLDDYHLISAAPIHAAVGTLLEQAPAHFHLILTTRSDPPLPLHRYRARQQMIEIRLSDLRFILEEVRQLFHALPELTLSSDDVSILTERTEGWIAGLQMAALSLRGKSDPSQFVRSLSGTHRFILDYLVEEVLKGQPALVQTFLVRTSILERLSGPLCDAVLGEDFFRTSSEYQDSQTVLEALERANLFLIPLDEERREFRYHPLLADLLRVRLRPAEVDVPLLHRRAGRCLSDAGEARSAIEHLIQAGDYESAADLVEQNSMRLFAQGTLHALVDWVRLLPGSIAARRPWLSLYQAWALAFAGQLADIDPLLDQARSALEGLDSAQIELLHFEISAISALVAVQKGDFSQVLALEPMLATAAASTRSFARSVLLWALGFAWRMQGHLPQATQAFEAVLAAGYEMRNPWTILTGSVDLGTLLRLAGRLEQAEQVYRSGLAYLQQEGMAGVGFVGRLESFLASVLLEKDELLEAESLARSSMTRARFWSNPNHIAHADWVMARILRSQGDLVGAEQCLRNAEQMLTTGAIVPSLRASLQALRLQLWLDRGKTAEASLWVEAHSPEIDDLVSFDEAQVILALAAARVYLAKGEYEKARRLLNGVVLDAHSAGKMDVLIQALVLQAAAQEPGALEQALLLGLPRGYRRVFKDVKIELPLFQEVALPPALRSCLEPLLPAANAPAENPLTERETQVLALMGQGLTNQEIGRRLFLSVGTVKAHSAAIFRKLQTANRAEAVARGKQLGLF